MTVEALHAYWRDPTDAGNAPASYAAVGAEASAFLVNLVNRYADADSTFLEIGCNVGRNLEALRLAGYTHLTGIEISAAAVQHGRDIYPDLDALIHPLPAEQALPMFDPFDVVFTMAVLEHIHPDSEATVFAEMTRLTGRNLIVIEDEASETWRHFPRDYGTVFGALHELETIRDVPGLPGFVARVFVAPSPARPIGDLAHAHDRETAYIVGRGASLLEMRAEAVGPGPVLALNSAILHVRALGLPNQLYSVQKDGCLPATFKDALVFYPVERTCRGACRTGELMAEPESPERLILCTVGSRDCFPTYPDRYRFDCDADFGVPPQTMSSAVAVKIAALMGCTRAVMIGHDAFTVGDTRRVDPDGSLHDEPHAGYALAGHVATGFAADAGIDLEWVKPSA
jgi:SAM-dependent methyltransferase